MKICIFLAIITFSWCDLKAQDYLYVSDAANFQTGPWKIFQFKSDGSEGKVFIDEDLSWPQDILFLEEKNEVLITNLNTGKINKYDASSGKLIGAFAQGIGGPTRMKIGPDGLLYVLQWSGDGKVKRYHQDGSFVDNFTKTGVNTSIGLDWDDQNRLYVSSYNGRFVERFDTTGKSLGKFVSAGLAGPTNIYFDDEKNLVVLDYNNGNVKRYDTNGKDLGTYISGIRNCEGVDFFENGNIVIGVGTSSSVNLYSSDGKLLKVLISSGSAGLKTPNAVILRKMTTSGFEQKTPHEEFIRAIGNRTFEINKEVSGEKIKLIQCIDSMGRTVVQFTPADQVLWHAASIPSGVYYFTAVTQYQKKFHQKIYIE